jgi:hypothetical protein
VILSRMLAHWLEENLGVRLLKGGRGPGQLPVAVFEPCKPGLHVTLLMIMMGGHTPNTLSEALEAADYQVCIVRGLTAGLDGLAQARPSLVIVCGPATPGAYLALRRSTSVPILALLPQASETDVMAALNAGVDDCQMASISSHEAILRTKALLRRPLILDNRGQEQHEPNNPGRR